MKSKNIAIYGIFVVIIVVVVLVLVLPKKSSSDDTPVSTSTTSPSTNPTTTSFSNMNDMESLEYSQEILDKYEQFIKLDYAAIQTQIKMVTSMRDALQSYMNSPNRTTSSIMSVMSEEINKIKHSDHYLKMYNLMIDAGSLISSNRKPTMREKAQILKYIKQLTDIEKQISNSMVDNIKDKAESLDRSQIMTVSSQLMEQLQQLQFQHSELRMQLKLITESIISDPEFSFMLEKQHQEFIELAQQHMSQPDQLKVENQIMQLREKIILYTRHLNDLRLLVQQIPSQQPMPSIQTSSSIQTTPSRQTTSPLRTMPSMIIS